jgi:DNA polymerase I
MKILAVDADNLIHRGFHAIPPMAGPDGTPNNALRGFCSGILNLIELTSPDVIICAFDAGVPTWRKEARPEYKANRKEKVQDLSVQLQVARTILCPALGFHTAWTPQIEADDQLHTIAQKASLRGDHVAIASGDKDLAQCLELDQIELWRPVKADKETKGWKEWTRQDVLTEWGVQPDQIAELLALIGDTADNLPGIKGVGQKTAAKWLQEHGSIANILTAAQENRLQPARFIPKLDPQILAANLLVTKAHDTGYELPSSGRTPHSPVECLEDLGLFKIARNWEILGCAGKLPPLNKVTP